MRSICLRSLITTTILLLTNSLLAQEAEIPLGSPIPGQDVALVDPAGKQVALSSLRGKASTTVLFWSNKCPWTAKYEERVLQLVVDLSGPDNSFVLVNSNDGAAFPDESAAAVAKYAQQKKLPVPYVTDPKSSLASLFGATRAPHVYVFDANATLVYVGAIDDSPGDPGGVTKQYLRDAITALTSGTRIASPQTKAFGCMIRPVR